MSVLGEDPLVLRFPPRIYWGRQGRSWYLHVLAHTEGLHGLPGVLKLQSSFQSNHRIFSCKLGWNRRANRATSHSASTRKTRRSLRSTWTRDHTQDAVSCQGLGLSLEVLDVVDLPIDDGPEASVFVMVLQVGLTDQRNLLVVLGALAGEEGSCHSREGASSDQFSNI